MERRDLKTIGLYTLTILIPFILLILFTAFMSWIIKTIYIIAIIYFFIALIALPVAFIPKTRRFIARLFNIGSFIFKISVYISSAIIIIKLCGAPILGSLLIIALILDMIGILPFDLVSIGGIILAFLICLFTAQWQSLIEIILEVMLIFGLQFLSSFIALKQRRTEYEKYF
jgi:hypothetical protein